jgi:DNA-binding winged helix-turn-helix (wHTH) protein/TolB-like protein/Flp pilus assembly protein TadD
MLVGHHVYEFGSFRLDVGEGRLLRDGDPVRIAPKALELLAVLVARAGRVVTKDDLMAELWAGTFVEDGNLTVHVSALRKLLGENAGWIETVPRRGYRFQGPVRELLVEPPEVPLVVLASPASAPGNRLSPPSVADPAASQPVLPASGLPAPSLVESLVTQTPARSDPAAPLEPSSRHIAGRVARPRTTLARWAAAALALVAVAALGLFLRARLHRLAAPSSAIHSIIVMPFDSAGTGGNARYLQLGLPAALVSRLSSLSELRLVPTAAVRNGEDPFEAATRLGVDGVITGFVASVGGRVQVTVELSRVSNRSIVWSGQFERQAAEIISIENEMAQQLADRVAPGATAAERGDLQRRETPNGEAYVLYLRGLEEWGRRTPDAIRTAILMYQNAIRLDPGFALAYAGLADAYAVTVSGMTPDERFPLARAAARKALSLDNNLATAHTTLAFLDYKADWRWEDAEREFRRALALDPNAALTHHWYGEFLGLLGRYDEGEQQLQAARRLDPYSVAILIDEAELLRKAGRLDAARTALDAGLKIQPGNALVNKAIGGILEEQGHADEAVQFDLKSRRLAGEPPEEIAQLTQAFAHGGARAYRQAYIRMLLASKGRATALPIGVATELATLYARAGDRRDTLKWLLVATDAHEDAPLELNSPEYRFLAGDPQFEALKKRVGL